MSKLSDAQLTQWRAEQEPGIEKLRQDKLRENARIKKRDDAWRELLGTEEFYKFILGEGFDIIQRYPDLPKDRDNEMATLGAMLMIDDDAHIVVLEQTHPVHYSYERNRLIWKAARQVHRSKQPVDWITVAASLRKAHKLEEAGGSEYLSACIESCPSALNVRAYIAILEDFALQRQLFLLGDLLMRRASAPNAESKQLLNALSLVADQLRNRGFCDMKAAFEPPK